MDDSGGFAFMSIVASSVWQVRASIQGESVSVEHRPHQQHKLPSFGPSGTELKQIRAINGEEAMEEDPLHHKPRGNLARNFADNSAPFRCDSKSYRPSAPVHMPHIGVNFLNFRSSKG